MKKIIVFTLLFNLAATTFSQEVDRVKPLTYNDYMQKNKNQKKVGWILLGGGSLLNIIGLATFPKDYILIDIYGNGNSSANESAAGASGVMIVVGTAAMLTSIPFFISSHVNRKKAIDLKLDTQQLKQLRGAKLYTSNYPALTMKLNL